MDDCYDCWIKGEDYKCDFVESYHCIHNYMRLELCYFSRIFTLLKTNYIFIFKLFT